MEVAGEVVVSAGGRAADNRGTVGEEGCGGGRGTIGGGGAGREDTMVGGGERDSRERAMGE